VSGSSIGIKPGIYGVQGISAEANVPGGRFSAASWTDSLGNLWLFGGSGLDVNGSQGSLNDLWKFSPSTGEWTWMNGSQTLPTTGDKTSGQAGTPGVYGTLGTPAAPNLPGARVYPVTATDHAGNIWLFGGLGYDAAGTYGDLNDLWVFNPVANEWAWMSGSSTVPGNALGQSPVYGAQGVFASTNVPGGRPYGLSWTGSSGNLWIFGGYGPDPGGAVGYLDDLWEYVPGPPAFSPAFALSTSGTVDILMGANGGTGATTVSAAVASGFTGAIGLTASGQPAGILVSFLPGSIVGAGTSVATITVDGSVALGTYPITVAGTSGSLSQNAVIKLIVSGTAAPTFSPPAGSYTTAQSVTISDTTPGATIYYTMDETVPTTNSNLYTGPIPVSSSTSLAAIAITTGYPESTPALASYSIGATSVLGEWAWMGGSQAPNSLGNYGIIGAPSAGGLPAARSDAARWTDKSGNLWLFGGSYNLSRIGEYNDLWRLIPAFNEWDWVGGNKPSTCSSSYGCGTAGVYGTLGAPATGMPGSRSGAATWVDNSGNLWLFGGWGYDSRDQFGWLNDLWKLNPATDQWTWMGGSTKEVLSFYSSYGNPGVYGTLGVPAAGNIPGSRYDAATWTDSQGNFWLFGGVGQDSIADGVLLNDLWEYNPTTNLWTWMSGSKLVDILPGYEYGVYGSLGVAAAANVPGSRSQAATWTDTSGNLWLFGGGPGGDFVQGIGNYNDLWKYSPATGQWTWMSGSSTQYCPIDPFFGYNACISPPGVFGTLGVPAAANVPPGGAGIGSWTDANGDFWLFGGNTSDVTGQNDGFYLGLASNLWVYHRSTGQWAWMGGDDATSNCSFIVLIPFPDVVCDGAQGNYGIVTLPGIANVPAARSAPVSWTDLQGNFWLFSGLSTTTANSPGERNDLWNYQPSSSTLPAAMTPIFSLKPGTYFSGGPLVLSNGMANASIHYTTDGSTPTFASTVYTGPITVASSITIRAMATAPGYRDSGVGTAAYVIARTVASPVFSPAPGSYTSTQMVTLSDATPGALIYFTTDGTPPNLSSYGYSGSIKVSSSETITAQGGLFGSTVLDGIANAAAGGVGSADVAATYAIVTAPVAPVVTVVAGSSSITTAQPLTVSVAVSGGTGAATPTGSMVLTSGGYRSAAVVLSSGSVTINLPAASLAVGTDTLTVSYTPDSESTATYTTAIGMASVKVTAASIPSFSIQGTALSLSPGATSANTSTITVTPSGGFTGNITLIAAINSYPSGATNMPSLSFGAWSPVSITGGSAGTATLTVTTNAPTSSSFAHPRFPQEPWYATGGAALAGILLLGLPAQRKNRWAKYRMLLLLGTLLGGVIACGSNGVSASGSGTAGTTAGNYIVTVTGTSGATTNTGMITLTVQ
jgi:N-acetylneuraminic acid mutarotase